jgi:hypothetical protein
VDPPLDVGVRADRPAALQFGDPEGDLQCVATATHLEELLAGVARFDAPQGLSQVRLEVAGAQLVAATPREVRGGRERDPRGVGRMLSYVVQREERSL